MNSPVDLYTVPHKALRLVLAQLLVSMGSTRLGHAIEAAPILDELAFVLQACDDHIAHEDAHVRPALVARRTSTVSTLDSEHAEHAEQVAELRSLMKALAASDSFEARTEIGATLYLHFSVFVAETFAHMAYEERVVQPLLDRLFSVAELQAIHGAIIASIPPPKMLVWLRTMVPASNRDERVVLLGNVKANAPAEVFAMILGEVSPRLAAEDAADLRARLAV